MRGRSPNGYFEDLEAYYKRSLLEARSPDDGLLIGVADDLRYAVNSGLLFFDKVFLMDLYWEWSKLILDMAYRTGNYKVAVKEIGKFLSNVSFLRGYKNVIVVPRRTFLEKEGLVKSWSMFEEKLTSSELGFIDLINEKSKEYLGIPLYYYKSFTAAVIYNLSPYTLDEESITGIHKGGIELINVANDGILDKHRLLSERIKHKEILECKDLEKKVRNLSPEDLEEIRKDFPPYKIRRAIEKYEPELEAPSYLSVASATSPIISMLTSFLGGARAYFANVGLNVLGYMDMISTITEAFKAVFGREKRYMVKFYTHIAEFDREARKRSTDLREFLRRLRDIL